MKVLSVLLDTTASDISRQLTIPEKNLINAQVNAIIAAGRKPILIIGKEGDDIIRALQKREDCDFVYETNVTQKALSGLRSGLFAAGSCAHYLPINELYPDEKVLLELEKRLITLPPEDDISIIEFQGKFPILVTPLGKARITKLSSTDDLDQNLDISRLHI